MRTKRPVGLLLVLSLGCASSYRPAPSPRVQLIRTGSGQAFVRDDQEYDHGLWGEGLADAVAGVPEAVSHANAYRNLQIGGFVCSFVGGAAVGFGLGAALREARSSDPGDTTTSTVVLLSGAALALLGSAFYLQSPAYMWDAINVHNDSIERAARERSPQPAPLVPLGAPPASAPPAIIPPVSAPPASTPPSTPPASTPPAP